MPTPGGFWGNPIGTEAGSGSVPLPPPSLYVVCDTETHLTVMDTLPHLMTTIIAKKTFSKHLVNVEATDTVPTVSASQAFALAESLRGFLTVKHIKCRTREASAIQFAFQVGLLAKMVRTNDVILLIFPRI